MKFYQKYKCRYESDFEIRNESKIKFTYTMNVFAFDRLIRNVVLFELKFYSISKFMCDAVNYLKHILTSAFVKPSNQTQFSFHLTEPNVELIWRRQRQRRPAFVVYEMLLHQRNNFFLCRCRCHRRHHMECCKSCMLMCEIAWNIFYLNIKLSMCFPLAWQSIRHAIQWHKIQWYLHMI